MTRGKGTEMNEKRAVCKDCFPDPKTRKDARESTKTVVHGVAVRPAPEKGPRCVTHHRAVTRGRKEVQHDAYVTRTYGFQGGEYQALYEYQGGHCALCLLATGESRKLSVDHDHKTGLARGLVCRPCNDLLGHARDDVAFFRRAMDYLLKPPAQQALGARYFQIPTTEDAGHDLDSRTADL